MKDCLSPEQIELLSQRRLRGQKFTDAILHVENCNECRARIRMPSIQELWRRLEENCGNTSSTQSLPNEDDEEFNELIQKISEKHRRADNKKEPPN